MYFAPPDENVGRQVVIKSCQATGHKGDHEGCLCKRIGMRDRISGMGPTLFHNGAQVYMLESGKLARLAELEIKHEPNPLRATRQLERQFMAVNPIRKPGEM